VLNKVKFWRKDNLSCLIFCTWDYLAYLRISNQKESNT